jgi:phosphatidylethanolamine/phosphatidyl-N-methylethanolamine N-methyltransferase
MYPDIDTAMVARAYARWAPVYDAVCGPIFDHGRRAAVEAAKSAGRRILEVGVGTGLSFPLYDARHEVTGIDLSEPMIEKARARLATGQYPHIRAVEVMDAHKLAFADGAFDCAVAQFVITLVENPEQVLSECARVVRPGGAIILVNHLYSEQGPMAAVERFFARHSRQFGLRPEFPFARLADWSAAHGGVSLAERRLIAPFRVYTLVRFTRESGASAPRATA